MIDEDLGNHSFNEADDDEEGDDDTTEASNVRARTQTTRVQTRSQTKKSRSGMFLVTVFFVFCL